MRILPLNSTKCSRKKRTRFSDATTVKTAYLLGALSFAYFKDVVASIVETKQVLSAKTKQQLRAALNQESRYLQNEAPESLPLLADQFNGMPGFYHGVASGDPLPTAVILWTRYTPMTWEETVELELRIAEVDENVPREQLLDPASNPELRFETVSVDMSTDFTAKIDLTGLTPNTHYVYAFTVGSGEGYKSSQVGQTRTAPGNTDDVEKLTYGLVSCAVYTNGYFHAYDIMSTIQDLDVWFHVGDYIYEYGQTSLYASDSKEREAELQPTWETVSLQDYRLRYALYRTDEGLQNLHRRAPLIAVWDDHEISDNSYGQGLESNTGAYNHQETCPAELDDPDFLKIAASCEFDEGSIVDRMQSAAKAYMEWLPTRRAPGTWGVVTGQGSLTKVIEWGNLATYVTFESRISNRSKEPTLSSVFSEFVDFAENNKNVTAYTDPESPVKAELDAIASNVMDKMYDPAFTMVGPENIALLRDSFEVSTNAGKIWQLYGSSTLMGPNVIMNPKDLWMHVPVSIQEQVKIKMDELLGGDGAGSLLRILTAMAVTWTPWNRDDFNGFANERGQILGIFRDNANNPLVLGGDLHDSWGWIMYDGDALTRTPVAVNIGAPGVTAPGIGEDLFALFEPIDELKQDVDGAYLAMQDAWVDLNEGLIHAQIRNRGFVVATVTKEKHVTEFHHISAENLLADYNTTREASGGLTSAYFCSEQYATFAGSPGSFESEGVCDAAAFNTAERPLEWSIPVPEKNSSAPISSNGSSPLVLRNVLLVALAILCSLH